MTESSKLIKPVSLLALLAMLGTAVATYAAEAPRVAPVPQLSDQGAVVVPTFELPPSTFASKEARRSLVARLQRAAALPTPIAGAGAPNIVEQRKLADKGLTPAMRAYAAQYPYTSHRSKVDNVPIETFIPDAGIAPENEQRVLISVHGGGFNQGGGGIGGAVEAIPFAGVGRIKVIAVDYRLQPEHTLDDAVEDIVTVYREVLKRYRPENIGMFGCSAGGALTGWTTAALMRQELPLPGAVGIFCASMYGFFDGDSGQLWPRLGSVVRTLPAPDGSPEPLPPLVPTVEEQRRFPPTLFLTGTRAFDMSGAVQSHLDLHSYGVDSELLLFDGMDHGFFLFGHSLPETRRAHELIVHFFMEKLGPVAAPQ